MKLSINGMIIIWPKHNDFKNTLLNEIQSNNYDIIQQEHFDTNKNYITNLLREIHYGKEWWTKNLLPEVEKRLSDNLIQKIEYLIVRKQDIHLYFKKFKKYVREKYNIDKSYFHISDPDCYTHLGQNCSCKCDLLEFNKETDKHIDMLTNENTIHFLKNSNFNPTYNFYRFFNIYKNGLLTNTIDDSKFCIDNGGILAAYGIRDTHDLDFLTLYNDNIKVNNPNIGCENKNHRLEYERLGYSIKDIIENPKNHFYHFGMKFMSLEILRKFKYNRTHTIGTGHKEIRKKDINDYNSIKNL